MHEVALELVARTSVQGWVPFGEKAEHPLAVLDRGV